MIKANINELINQAIYTKKQILKLKIDHKLHDNDLKAICHAAWSCKIKFNELEQLLKEINNEKTE